MIISRPKSEIEKRSRLIRSDFARIVTDALREKLFNAQSGLCQWCKKDLQGWNSVVAEIDHAVPVYLYATWDYSIEDACRHANARKNLVLAHPACNKAKGALDYEEFEERLASGEVAGKPKKWTPEEIEKEKQRLSAINRKGGSIQGRRNVESGHWANIQKIPQTKHAQKRNGHNQGRRNVESGQLAALRTPEHQALAGHINGCKNVESGQVQALGHSQGRKNVVSGHLARLRTLEHQTAASRAATHVRWHVKRGIKNLACKLCRAASFIFLLLIANTVRGQAVVELQGGAGNLLGVGAGFTAYGANGETRFSAGMIGGHFAWSASERFDFRDWEVSAGSEQFAITSGQMSLNVPIQGISLTRKRPYTCKNSVQTTGKLVGYSGQRCRGDQLTIFVGAVGNVFSSPYFFAVTHPHAGAGFGYKYQWNRHFDVGTIEAIAGSKHTNLGEANFHAKHFELRTQAGYLENNLQISGNASASWSHVGFTGGRSTYIFSKQSQVQPGPVLPARVTVNNFGVYGGYSRFSGSAALFRSNLNTGKSFSVGARFGFVQVQASNYVSGKQSSKLVTVTEHSLHWTLSQYITRSAGTTNASFGAGYSSNRLNVQAGYSVLYFPALQQPFQKVLSITVGFRLRGVSINTGTIVQPNGRNTWQVGGDDYLQTRMRLPSMPGATSSARYLPSSGHGGKYTVEGAVVDDKGAPVEGACVTVGNDAVFTNSQGYFSIREKHRDTSIMVNPDNFMTGDWEVVSAPTVARAGEPVRIVVRKR